MIGMRLATATLREVPRMEELASIARKRARQLGHAVLVSVTTTIAPHDPLALFARAVSATKNRFFWSVPSAGLSIAGLGSAWNCSTGSDDQIALAQADWRTLMDEAVISAEPGTPFGGPLAFAGFAFDPQRPATPLWAGFPRGALVLPRLVLAQTAEQTTLTLNGFVGAKDSSVQLGFAAAGRLRELLGGAWKPARQVEGFQLQDGLPAEEWQAIVGDAVAEIQAGSFEKVVMARQVQVRSATPFMVPAALDALRRDYPDCFVFAIARGGRIFLGASPERLVALQQGVVTASGLAGSTARGATPEEDARLGAELLASPKERAEHAVVVDTIRDTLAELADEIEVPAEPRLMQMRNVQHLFTPIRAQLRGKQSILDLVGALHPTPAVGGRPRDAALAFIREREQLDRGWYAGPVGWIDAAGNGEFAVALRSALVGRNEATLFAGCGIVAGSDPAREYRETQLKLRPMLSALGEQNSLS